MFNSGMYFNSRPDGIAVLEIVGAERRHVSRQFAPLKQTKLTGKITGPLASLQLTQKFSHSGEPGGLPIEALYRFPLPGDAAVTGVTVRFGDVEIRTALKERSSAEAEYEGAKRQGRQSALLTRESPDVFTLAVAGIKSDEEVQVVTDYVQLARGEGNRWSLRIPLTTAPRYVRADEEGSRHAEGQPLAVLRDPGHRFTLDLSLRGASAITSATHALDVSHSDEGDRVRLREGDVIPDRDCVLNWQPAKIGNQLGLQVWVQPDPASGQAYFLALCQAPLVKARKSPVAREVILLVDHSGSMEGAKWEAADWAVERFLAGLTAQDAFALGVFHNSTRWLVAQPRAATPKAVQEAVTQFRAARDIGGTELGVALEQALDRQRAENRPARHILIVTDAEVTDAGRLLRLADRETGKGDRRRISLLCIDAAPNSTLATELAERGGGLSRFLTSDPDENDVTTALDEVLTDWSAPSLVGLTLEVNRPRAEATGRLVSLRTPDVASAIDLGDPPAGRPVWVAGRIALSGPPLEFRLHSVGGVACKVDPEAGEVAGLRALFGSKRIRRLEYLIHAGFGPEELSAELSRLGYDSLPGDSQPTPKVYAENRHSEANEMVRDLLVRESLKFGLPSAETAFIATRLEAGQQVGETLVVANALPAGWSSRFAGGAAQVYGSGVSFSRLSTTSKRRLGVPRTFSAPAVAAADFDEDTSTDFDPLERQSRVHASRGRELRFAVVSGQFPQADGAVLYDSKADTDKHALPASGRLAALSVTANDATVTVTSVGQNLNLLLFVGDMADPRARIQLADLLPKGSRRPLNIRWQAGQIVRLMVEDPDGRWTNGVPAMEIVLGWEG